MSVTKLISTPKCSRKGSPPKGAPTLPPRIVGTLDGLEDEIKKQIETLKDFSESMRTDKWIEYLDKLDELQKTADKVFMIGNSAERISRTWEAIYDHNTTRKY